jgi:hypothetical protein
LQTSNNFDCKPSVFIPLPFAALLPISGLSALANPIDESQSQTSTIKNQELSSETSQELTAVKVVGWAE